MGIFDRCLRGVLGSPLSGPSGGSGEINTASNLGAGAGVFAQKVGVDLQFKSLVAGTNITLTPSATEILIDASGGGNFWETAIPNESWLKWRNAANDADINVLKLDVNDDIHLGESTNSRIWLQPNSSAMQISAGEGGGNIWMYSANVDLISFSPTPGFLRFFGANDDQDAIAIRGPNIITPYDLILPAAQGGASTFLQNDGAGNLSWVAASGITWATPIDSNITVDTHNTYNLGTSAASLAEIFSQTYNADDGAGVLTQMYPGGVGHFNGVAQAFYELYQNVDPDGANVIHSQVYTSGGGNPGMDILSASKLWLRSTGVLALRTTAGTSTAAINITTGNASSTTSGAISLTTGTSAGANQTGNISIISGTPGGASQSGNLFLESGSGGHASGFVNLKSGNITGSGITSGSVNIASGNSSLGNSGGINITTGSTDPSGGSQAGDINIETGVGSPGGTITLTTGNSVLAGQDGPDMMFNTGSAQVTSNANGGDFIFSTGGGDGTGHSGDVSFTNTRTIAVSQLAADPTGDLVAGMLYYNTTSNKLVVYNGTTWETVTSV